MKSQGSKKGVFFWKKRSQIFPNVNLSPLRSSPTQPIPIPFEWSLEALSKSRISNLVTYHGWYYSPFKLVKTFWILHYLKFELISYLIIKISKSIRIQMVKVTKKAKASSTKASVGSRPHSSKAII